MSITVTGVSIAAIDVSIAIARVSVDVSQIFTAVSVAVIQVFTGVTRVSIIATDISIAVNGVSIAASDVSIAIIGVFVDVNQVFTAVSVAVIAVNGVSIAVSDVSIAIIGVFSVGSDCELQHSVLAPAAGPDVADLLLGGEEVVASLPCLGFVNFPGAKEKEIMGDCHIVMAQASDGDKTARRIFMLVNDQACTTSAAVSDLDGFKTVRGVTNRWSAQAAHYSVERYSRVAIYTFSVEQQLLSMYFEAATQTNIQRSRQVLERLQEVGYCSLCGCIPARCVWRSLCCCRRKCCRRKCCRKKMCACTCWPRTDTETTFESKISTSTAANPLADIVCNVWTQDAEGQDGMATRVHQAQYLGVQFRFADPHTSKMHEAIAVVDPAAGHMKCMKPHYASSSSAEGDHVDAARKPAKDQKASTNRKHVFWQPHPALYEDGKDPFEGSRDGWHQKNFNRRGTGHSNLRSKSQVVAQQSALVATA
eukprot:g1539.t1